MRTGKIICVGRNYVEHIKELGNEIPENMVIFLKPATAVTDTLLAVHGDEPLHYEGEISFLYEKGRFTKAAFGLDLTKRGLQSRLKEKGLPWERAKAFDGAALFSSFVPFDGDYESLSLSLEINGQTIQSAGAELMMYKPREILEEIASFMTLEEGDIVMTGTPKGVGVVREGDQFRGCLYCNKKLIVEQEWTAAP